MTDTSERSTSRTQGKRVHAIDVTFNLLCGQRGGNRTSIVRRPYDRDKLAKLVTCRKCKRIMANG